MNWKQDSKEIEEKILQKITPSCEEKNRLQKIIKALKKDVRREIKKRKIPADPILVGSTAKDTYLKNNLDIDLFLLFPTNFSKEQLKKHVISIGRKVLQKPQECYAEHPYIRGIYKDYKTEIVPCYKIEYASQKISAVDRTPLHTEYVKKHLQEQQKREVRLLKQFLKGIGCYGAEAEIEGFSGYLCEILIIKYGSFQKVLEDAQNWNIGKKLYLSKEKEKKNLPDFDEPLTFIDPVDHSRNVASAVSKEKLVLFIKASREYIKKPSITFFFPRKIKTWPLKRIKEKIGKTGYHFVGIKLPKPDIIPENLYPQIRKALRSIKDLCLKYDFKVMDIKFHVDETNDIIYIILQTDKTQLSKTFTHKGPPTRLKKNVEEFLQKWKNNPRVTKKPYEKNGRLYVEIKREYIEIKKLLKNKLTTLSLGKHIDEVIKKKGYNILDVDDLLVDDLKNFWTAYLDKKMPWER